MIVKIKCRDCGTKHIVKKPNLKAARKFKRTFKNKLCGMCEFKAMAKINAKEIVGRFKKIC